MSVLTNLLECAKLLIKAGADVDARTLSGTNPLLHAAYDGLTDFIKILLEAGADPNVVDKSGNRPIEVAAMSAKRHAVEILFYVTSPIPYMPDWSVDGIISYVSSKRFKPQAMEIYPADATIFSNRSLCWLRQGEGDRALHNARVCRMLRPEWPEACYCEGAAHSLLKDYAGAADAFLDGLTLDPGNEKIEKALREAVESMKKLHCSDKKQ